MTDHSPTRPFWQFSLQGLLVLTSLIAVALAVVSGHLSIRVLAHYCFLLFAVGPWFAYLMAECLPVASAQLRTAAANMILLVLFVVTLKLAETVVQTNGSGPVALVVALAAALLWTPQYMMFFVWRMGE